MRPLFLVLASVSQLSGQSALPKFEVASVRPAALTRSGTPWDASRKLTTAPGSGRVELRYISLLELLMLAFQVEKYQVSGPNWLGTAPFDISAVTPAGTPRDQLPLMLQDLLAERFHLRYRQETRDAPVYALMVAPSGAKLRPAIADDDPDHFGPIQASTSVGPKGPVRTLSARTGFGIYQLTVTNGLAHYEFLNMTMAGLAAFLSPTGGRGMLDLPVSDSTGLTGHYQIALDVLVSEMHSAGLRVSRPVPGNGDVPEASEPFESAIAPSLAKQGIRLVRVKVPAQVVVVDEIDRRPSAN